MSFSPTAPLSWISAHALLVSSPADRQPGWVYFLCAQPQPGYLATPQGDPPSLAALWAGTSGILLFANNRIEPGDGDGMTALLQQLLHTPANSPVPWRVVAWTDDPYDPVDLDGLRAAQSKPGVFTLHHAWTGKWGPLSLMLSKTLTISLGAPSDPAALCIKVAPLEVSLLQLALGGKPVRIGYSANGFNIPIRLAGPGAGSLRVAMGLDPSVLLWAFRCGFMYAAGPSTVFYPMLQALPRTTRNMRPFDVWLNPIRPLDASYTRFSIDGAGRLAKPGFAAPPATAPDPYAARYFSDRFGGAITLHPFDPGDADPAAIAGGFAFSVAQAARVPGGLPGPSAYYLSPCGLWRTEGGQLCLMPGLAGEEFLALGPDDRLEFMPNCPARAMTDAGIAGLGDDVTTSWVRVQPGAGGPPGYFSQPGASSFFGGTEAFPVALDVRLASFAATSAVFPFVPYRGVYEPVPADLNPAYLPAFAGAGPVLQDLEAETLAPTRHAILAQSPSGPVLMPEGQPSPAAMLDRAATPQGLLLELTSPQGTIAQLVIARTPANPEIEVPALRLCMNPGPDGLLPPRLGNLLTRNQLMLVVSTWTADVPAALFQNRLNVGGFGLAFDVGVADGTILVFKFNDGASLADLAANPATWSDAGAFNPDPSAVSARLCASIAAARTAADPAPFASFLALVDDATWTGVIAFDVQVDGNDMPLDLQALLGGIQGDLRAHHIGVEANRLALGNGHSLDLIESSLFGVIRYDEPPGRPTTFPDYEVEHLLIVFSNGRVVRSDASIGITFDTMFGRPIWLKDVTVPPNTLRIPGTSQLIDGADTISFTTAAPAEFDFVPPPGPNGRASNGLRVLRRIVVTHASLVPVSRTPIPGGAAKTIVLRLLMEGRLWFDPDPFRTGMDLFSYGAGPTGVPFTGLSVEIAFALDGMMVPGSKTTKLHEDLMQAAPSADSIRPNSFLGAMPAQFTRLVTTGAGLDAAVAGAAAVHIHELEVPVPHTLPKPVWAMEYDIHLGSLGAMADDHAGMAAKLLLGWGPSPVAPDDDAAAMLVQLPHLGGGIAGFSLEGLLTTRFGDANLVRVNLATPPAGPDWVYAILFNNVQLAFLGQAFPPGLLVDFAVFAGAPDKTARNTNNIAWFLGAKPGGRS